MTISGHSDSDEPTKRKGCQDIEISKGVWRYPRDTVSFPLTISTLKYRDAEMSTITHWALDHTRNWVSDQR